ncbi:MAG: response regulator [Chloroflexota bacterium]|nr:response regulator [Chloroflexota bacterium]
MIKVLVVDDVDDTRSHIAKLISFEPDVEVVGSAGSGREALELAATLQPDVVLMDINMPGMDGIQTTEQLARRVPGAAIVMMSIHGDADYLRRSMVAGAREFLVKPFSGDELIASMRAVHARNAERRPTSPVAVGPGMAGHSPASPAHRGRVVALFSPKGGVGRSTLAVNIAVAAASERHRVALVDGSFQFGDIALLLNLNPRSATIADVLADGAGDDRGESIDNALITHASGVRVLLPPPSPEMAELVNAKSARSIVERLRQQHDLVIVDTWPLLQEPALTLLDTADEVLCVVTLDLTTIKNTRVLVALADKLGYGDGKLKLVLNRADSGHGISIADVEHSVGRKVDYTVVSDARTVVNALNRGLPFFSLNRQAQISRDVAAIARALVDGPEAANAPAPDRQQPRRLALARH